MTDLESMIQEINNTGGLNQSQKSELKGMAKGLATAKGELGAGKRKQVRDRIAQMKTLTQIKPEPNTQIKPEPNTQIKPEPPDSGDGGHWPKFTAGYKDLEPNDKKIVKNVFPETNDEDSFKKLSLDKRKVLTNAVLDGKIKANEKDAIYKAFKYKPGRDPKDDKPPKDEDPRDENPRDERPPSPGKAWVWDKSKKKWVKPKRPAKGKWEWDDDRGWVSKDPDDDDPDDDDPDDDDPDDDDEDDDDEDPDPGSGEPTVKGGGKKINIPKPENRANTEFPGNAQRVSMPNLDRRIKKEIERVTLRLIKTTKEFIEGGTDFSGIDYIAENEIIGADGKPYYPLPDFNSPGGSDTDLAEVRANEIKELIHQLLNKGKKKAGSEYNYLEYLDLFELRYNGVGDPTFRFSIELTGSLVEDLTVLLVEEDFNNK